MIFHINGSYSAIGNQVNLFNPKDMCKEYLNHGTFEEFKVRTLHGHALKILDISISDSPPNFIILVIDAPKDAQEDYKDIITLMHFKKCLTDTFPQEQWVPLLHDLIKKLDELIWTPKEFFDEIMQKFFDDSNDCIFWNNKNENIFFASPNVERIFTDLLQVPPPLEIKKIRRCIGMPVIHPKTFYKYIKIFNKEYVYVEYRKFIENSEGMSLEGVQIKHIGWKFGELHPNQNLLFKLIDSVPLPCVLLSEGGGSVYSNKQWESFDETNSLKEDFMHHIKVSQEKNIEISKNNKTLNLNCKWLEEVLQEPYCLVIGQDKTQEKNEKIYYQDITERLEQSNNELKRFAHLCSHDLKEPLRSISNFAQLIKNNPDQMNSYIDLIIQNTFYMKNLVENLLKYAEYEYNPEQMEYVYVRSVIRMALNAVSSKIKEVGADINITDKIPNEIYGHKVQLTQIFQNVLDNALKFKSDKDPVIYIDYEYVNNNHRFIIKDNGIGIDNQYLDQVFIMFKRLHPKDTKQGSGIGLAMCRKIAENHKGKIWITSQINEGTSVFFEIPDKRQVQNQCVA